MIVATAGHIDHGKTSLVRALTGVDTDRLPQERARGISIDLGFAYIPSEGGLIGFVDVPGHERFVRNMLAGVAGIDLALLVVAADDGVMPQTREHLQILHLLDVRRGIVVVTKCDRVPAERCDEVGRAVQALLADTPLAGSPQHRVSALTGEGIDGLLATLSTAAREHRSRLRDGQHVRLAVDRVFTVAGTGTVVTGTVFNGRVARGDRLVVAPAGHPVRVRGIEIRGIATEAAQAGERCALGLAGVEASQVRRGDWVLDPAQCAPTQRVDVLLRVLATEPAALEHWSAVHVHVGTDALTARVATERSRAIGAGGRAHAQLVLDRPVTVVNGDRFILRDQAGRRTIGGGVVIDPFPPRRRAPQGRAEVREALALGDPAASLAALLQVPPGVVDAEAFRRSFDLTDARLAALLVQVRATRPAREHHAVIAIDALQRLKADLPSAVGDHLRAHPASSGIEVEALHRSRAAHLPIEAFNAVLRDLAQASALVLRGGLVSLPRHDATANPADLKLWARVSPLLEAGGHTPPTVAELAQSLRMPPGPLQDFLHRKTKTGELFRVGDDRFYPRPSVARLARTADELARSLPEGLFTAAQYRDATGLGRRLAIRVLELFDACGVTRRVGDSRRIRRPYADAFGEAHGPFERETSRAED
jgi:selenocysteine-specific elongation factor